MFRRGFKTWSEQTALRARQKLKLSPGSPMDPLRLAELLGVFVLQPDDLPDLGAEVRLRLTSDHCDCWCAITVGEGSWHVIVIISYHARTRLGSSLAHEIAAMILRHGA